MKDVLWRTYQQCAHGVQQNVCCAEMCRSLFLCKHMLIFRLWQIHVEFVVWCNNCCMPSCLDHQSTLGRACWTRKKHFWHVIKLCIFHLFYIKVSVETSSKPDDFGFVCTLPTWQAIANERTRNGGKMHWPKSLLDKGAFEWNAWDIKCYTYKIIVY